LGGVRCELKSGDTFDLQYRHNHARFRVVWIATPDGSHEKHLGAEIVELHKDIWELEVPEEPDEYEEKD
jgi:hypothetical protein